MLCCLLIISISLCVRRCYFSLNPDASVGGVLQQDWTTPEPGRLSFLKPFLAAPFQNIDPYGPLPPPYRL